jgi:hypothetical protein
MTKRAPWGLPVKIRMQMTPDDIASAVCNSRRHCALAQTIYRQLEQPIGRVRVMTSGISIAADDGYRYYYRVPVKACRLVRDFDAGKPVEPITFILLRTNREKITPVPEARKQQVNKARREREAALAELGVKPKTYTHGRYGI